VTWITQGARDGRTGSRDGATAYSPARKPPAHPAKKAAVLNVTWITFLMLNPTYPRIIKRYAGVFAGMNHED
jgi:hypothetical protein